VNPFCQGQFLIETGSLNWQMSEGHLRIQMSRRLAWGWFIYNTWLSGMSPGRIGRSWVEG
jgi:hypothetical protein